MRTGEPQLIADIPDALLVEALADAEQLEAVRRSACAR